MGAVGLQDGYGEKCVVYFWEICLRVLPATGENGKDVVVVKGLCWKVVNSRALA